MNKEFFEYRIWPFLRIFGWIYWLWVLIYVFFEYAVYGIQPTNWYMLVLVLLPILEILSRRET